MELSKTNELVLKCLKDENFKKELISNPKATIEKEYGKALSNKINVQVLLVDPNTITLVIPNISAKETQALNDEQLEQIAAGMRTNGSGPWCPH